MKKEVNGRKILLHLDASHDTQFVWILYGGREWAQAEDSVRGFSFTPTPKSVPQAVIEDARLYELLALVDTLGMAGSANANRPGSN